MAVSTRLRNQKGGMLGMVVLVGGIVIVVALVGFAVSILFTSHHRAQTQADDAALQMALLLNKNDWSGQMNNIVESARELVYTSRQDNDDILANNPSLAALSNRLLQEARDASVLVDEQRISLAQELGKQTQNMAAADRAQDKPSQFNLPWMRTESMKISDVELGYIKNVASSVQVPVALDDLKAHDLKERLANEKSLLYYANINARLPEPDDDLAFNFSSLPAAVENSVPTARLTSDAVFEKLTTVFANGENTQFKIKVLPSAVHMRALMGVQSSNGKDNLADSVRVDVNATTNGADLQFP